MRRTQLVAALLVCAVIGLSRPGSAQDATRPTILNVTMDAAGDQLCRRLARPHRPPWPQRLVRPPDLPGQPGTRRYRPRAFWRGHAEPHGGGDDQPHQVAAGHPGLAQRRHEVHGPNPPTDHAATPGPAPGWAAGPRGGQQAGWPVRPKRNETRGCLPVAGQPLRLGAAAITVYWQHGVLEARVWPLVT